MENIKNIVNSIILPKGWIFVSVEKAKRIEEELRKELGKKHSMHGHEFVVLAKKESDDDVLLYLPKNNKCFAVTHLTWTSAVEENSTFPFTTFYNNVDELGE